MKIITEEQIGNIGISTNQCIEWVREAFLIKDKCQLPPKISLHPQGSDFINTMPCLLPPEYHCFGCKIVSRIKGSHPALKSQLMIFDSSTGNMTALLDSNWITAMRTGAVATLAIETFRNSKSRTYSFIGLGVMGSATLDCLLPRLSKDSDITIRFKKYKDHAEKAVEKYSVAYPHLNFEISKSIDELVDKADVIVSCITDAEGLLVDDIGLFKPGVLLVPVHTRGFQNCDTIFDKIFADDEGHVKGFRYFNEFKNFGEMSEVLKGKNPGRENDTERIISYNIGLGLQDVFFANKIIDILNK